MIWKTARERLDLSKYAVVMGILNVTPDSFSDGGAYLDADRAAERALLMREEGAGIIDVGGESTRPGARPVSVEEEKRRVIPVIQRVLAMSPECLVSIDTSKAEVARAAMDAGAAIINDVTGLRGDAAMSQVVAETRAGVVLMHMQGTPETMQCDPHYDDVVGEVRDALRERTEAALAAGIPEECVALDPGIGFGKNLEHNLLLLRRLAELPPHGRPLVVGVSRKSFLGRITENVDPTQRLWPTVALTALLRQRGARVFRVHDARENVAALKAAEAVLGTDG